MSTIRVLHLSDIHFSESDFWKGADQNMRAPHRYGHDPACLLALDRKIKEIDYDILILSGDLTRVGHLDSFAYVKNWLYEKMMVPGGGEIGLNIEESGKPCFVIPGNHDCFNERLMQHSLDNYHQYFEPINGAKTETTTVNGIVVNVHLYDSTNSRGGFGKGVIDPTAMQNWETAPDTLDLVVLHHHVVQAPEHRRQPKLEIENCNQFLAFILARDVNGVFFGHTHEFFFEKVSAEMLRKQIRPYRGLKRLVNRMIPRFFRPPEATSLSFPRQTTKSGRYPKLDQYFEYLYLKEFQKVDVKGPEYFKEPHHFYDHLKSFRSHYDEAMTQMRKRKVAFSMTASPTYADAHENGFQLLSFDWDGKKFIYECERYVYNGADFEKTKVQFS